jgi:hypothetical protein
MISRREGGDRSGGDPSKRGQAQRPGLGVAHDGDGGGAVVERAGVAGSDEAVRAEYRLEPAMLSAVTPPRGPSSVETTVPAGVVIGVISRAKKAVGDRHLGEDSFVCNAFRVWSG